MPYILSPLIRPDAPGLWAEGAPYSVEPIYDLCNPAHPPVRYDAHRLAPHSLPHVDAPSHILEDGGDVGSYFTPARIGNLYGPVLLLKLATPDWQDAAGGRHCRVDAAMLRSEVLRATGRDSAPDKLILSLADLPMTAQGQHDPAAALTLAEDADAKPGVQPRGHQGGRVARAAGAGAFRARSARAARRSCSRRRRGSLSPPCPPSAPTSSCPRRTRCRSRSRTRCRR